MSHGVRKVKMGRGRLLTDVQIGRAHTAQSVRTPPADVFLSISFRRLPKWNINCRPTGGYLTVLSRHV